jgi:hypothetical protein
MVMVRWHLFLLWGWSILSAVILVVLVWLKFAERSWQIEDPTNRLQWRMLKHPKYWAFNELRSDGKELKQLIGGPYHYGCGGDIRFTPDPSIGMDRPVCSRCDREKFDICLTAHVPAAHNRLAVAREMQRRYRTKQKLSKIVSLEWTS